MTGTSAGTARAPLRVLIVEDDPGRQESLRSLFRDHAWILVHTAERAVRLLEAYEFDLVCLDYDLAGPRKGDAVAAALQGPRNARARVLVHSMSAVGAARIRSVLPRAHWVPFSRLVRTNEVFKRVRAALEEGVPEDWEALVR